MRKQKTLNSGSTETIEYIFICRCPLRKYRNLKLLTLRLLGARPLLVLSFLLYDEMESDLMLVVYRAVI